MNESRKQLEADRLFQAAEAMMVALSEMPKAKANVVSLQKDLIGTAEAPKACWGFTMEELDEARNFLVRLGYITVSKRA